MKMFSMEQNLLQRKKYFCNTPKFDDWLRHFHVQKHIKCYFYSSTLLSQYHFLLKFYDSSDSRRWKDRESLQRPLRIETISIPLRFGRSQLRLRPAEAEQKAHWLIALAARLRKLTAEQFCALHLIRRLSVLLYILHKGLSNLKSSVGHWLWTEWINNCKIWYYLSILRWILNEFNQVKSNEKQVRVCLRSKLYLLRHFNLENALKEAFEETMTGAELKVTVEAQPFREVLPKRGLIFQESSPQLVLCKPKLLPLKSFTLVRQFLNNSTNINQKCLQIDLLTLSGLHLCIKTRSSYIQYCILEA